MNEPDVAAPAPIRITGLTVHVTRIPVLIRRRHGSGDVEGSVRNAILRLDTDAGITGWGDAAPWAVFTGTVEAAAAALHVYLRPVLIGADPFRVGALMEAADRAVVGHPEAKAAMEMALFDVVGQAAGLPVAELLGGRCRDEIPLSFSVADPDFDRDIETVRRLYGEGLRLFKMKTGFAGHAQDLRRMERFRAEVPADAELRVDYNQGMAAHDAIRQLRDVEAFRPTFIEQPVPGHQRAALGEIARALDTPVLADESVFTPSDALTVAAGRLADLVSIKIMKHGGMMAGRKVAAICEAAGMACYGGDMFETGIAHLAGTHMIAATPNISLGCEFYQTTYFLERDLLAEPFPVENGRVVVPRAPGLGVRVDEDRLRHYAVETLR
ncbi:MAG TPA: enolase C-terminal domain-like protein [Geminicoccaceae bacterium]|nr:enolase C-terminal domain-like protein [Geminicoccaceae bacterium]